MFLDGSGCIENDYHFQSGIPQAMARRDPKATRSEWALAIVITLGTACGSDTEPTLTVTELGEALFFDTNLSWNRTQACATCHNPEHAFIDDRLDDDGQIAAVSVGDDGTSLGDRNAPTAGYAAFTTPLELGVGTRRRFNKQSRNRTYEGALGGFFLDGRASGLEGQAAGPPLNPLEMGMPDEASVVARIEENPEYVRAFRAHFGQAVFDEPATAYAAMTDAIAAFESTEEFAPFDSKYDRWLVGEATFSFIELTGKSLFFSEFTNCAICHQLHSDGDPVNGLVETFSGYEYHNIGVPENEAVRADNGVTDPDLGLASNTQFDDPTERGKFKVPTLRNVAVTEPYMHNGVFRDLKTTVLFYEHFVDPELRPTNPETGEPWREPEIPETVSTELLEVGDSLTDFEVDALVCFLRTLTDQRYEHLIQEKGVSCGEFTEAEAALSPRR